MTGPFLYMRLRKAPYTEFKRVSTSLDDFSSVGSSPVFMLNNVPMMDLELKQNDLISFMNPMCPHCSSRNVVKNGTCLRIMGNGIQFRVQRYLCRDCRYSFVARPPNYGYGKHFPDDVREKGIRSRIRTSLRKAANLFHILGDMMISHETVRKCIPPVQYNVMESSGHFVYDEQYVHIGGEEKYRALLKDSKTGNFVESILDDLSGETLIDFFVQSLRRFRIHKEIYVTTDGFHYSSMLKEASHILGIRIRRQRCLFHIEKDLAHRIRDSHRENELDTAKKLIKFMFFQNETNLERLGRNSESMRELIRGKDEREIVDIVLYKINSLYGEYPIMRSLLAYLRKHRKEVFLYMDNPEVEKKSDKAEQHFSVQSWLFKHRFKTKDGLLRTSYWYHWYLSTEN